MAAISNSLIWLGGCGRRATAQRQQPRPPASSEDGIWTLATKTVSAIRERRYASAWDAVVGKTRIVSCQKRLYTAQVLRHRRWVQ